MFVFTCPVVVRFYVLNIFRIIIILSVLHVLWYILEHYSATCKSKGIRNQNNVTSFSNFIRPGKVAVIHLLMFFHRRMLIIRSPCDFTTTKVLVSSMIMKSKNAG